VHDARAAHHAHVAALGDEALRDAAPGHLAHLADVERRMIERLV
jgi:hypothetical protein